MATSQIPFNPAVQSAFPGTFTKSTYGYTQGSTLPDVAIRYSLRRGINAPAATVPLFGGQFISETLPQGGIGSTQPAPSLQSILAAATGVTAGSAGVITGVTVNDQATARLQTAQNRVPVAGSGGAISFYRMGCGARIPFNLNPTVAAAMRSQGLIQPTAIYWDPTNLWITNASGGGALLLTTLFPQLSIEDIQAGNSRVVALANGAYNWSETGSTIVLKI